MRPVILCGGSGTRLWPLSCKSYSAVEPDPRTA
ncbi:sugar phosphate nucleotidyltransferase [Yoonia sp. GPGPB17]